jgi:hypothetical protein
MREATLIDLYKEMGILGDVLLLLFLAILAFAGVIHFRRLDQRWRRSFLLLCALQGGTGLLCGIMEILGAVTKSRRAHFPTPEYLFTAFSEVMIVLQLAAWLTIILLAVSAILFVTGKREAVE